MTADRMKKPEEALKELLTYSRNRGYDPLIVDTAGRLHIDDELMAELRLAKDILQPAEVIYVGDAMTGQDAVRSAQAFEEKNRVDIYYSDQDGWRCSGRSSPVDHLCYSSSDKIHRRRRKVR